MLKDKLYFFFFFLSNTFATSLFSNPKMTEYLILILVGIGCGFISTIAGGGSLLTLPLLIFLGLPPSIANGTNRVAVVVQTMMATIGFKSKKVPILPFNIYVGISALLGSIIGATIAVDISEDIFNRILSIVMIIVLLIIIFESRIKFKKISKRIKGKYLLLSIISFFFIGVYGGFINAGMGFIIILFLRNINKMPFVKANVTKAIVIFMYTASSLVIFALNDKVNWEIGFILALGNAIGAFISSRISVNRGDKFVRKILIVVVIVMVTKFWFF